MVTAEEFFREKIKENYQVPSEFSLSNMDFLNAEKAMIWAHEYSILKARHHVEKALNDVIDNLYYIDYCGEKFVSEQSIVAAYPLENIK